MTLLRKHCHNFLVGGRLVRNNNICPSFGCFWIFVLLFRVCCKCFCHLLNTTMFKFPYHFELQHTYKFSTYQIMYFLLPSSLPPFFPSSLPPFFPSSLPPLLLQLVFWGHPQRRGGEVAVIRRQHQWDILDSHGVSAEHPLSLYQRRGWHQALPHQEVGRGRLLHRQQSHFQDLAGEVKGWLGKGGGGGGEGKGFARSGDPTKRISYPWFDFVSLV